MCGECNWPLNSPFEKFYGECKECGHFLDEDGKCAFCPWINDNKIEDV